MEGEGERKRRRWGVKGLIQVYTMHTMQTELSRWITQCSRSGVSSLLYTFFKILLYSGLLLQIPPPLSVPLLLIFSSSVRPLAFSPPALGPVRGLFKHNLFPLVSPGSIIQPFYCCVFSPFFLSASPIYLQLDVCSSIDCFTEDMSGLCLWPAQLYIDPSVLKDVRTDMRAHTHTHPLAQLVVNQCPVERLMHNMCHIGCNQKAMITGLSCHRRCVENECVTFHHN